MPFSLLRDAARASSRLRVGVHCGDTSNHDRGRYAIGSFPGCATLAIQMVQPFETVPRMKQVLPPNLSFIEVNSPINAEAQGFLETGDPDLLLDTWKPAENGRGTILRFLDLGGAGRTVTGSMPLFTLQSAIQTDAVERDQAPLPLTSPHALQLAVKPHQIVPVRVLTSADSGTTMSPPAGSKPAP